VNGTVLLAATTWWPAPARLAMVFRRLGWRVQAICPRHHPLRYTRAVNNCRNYPFYRSVSALRDAITGIQPDLIVPCDDRTVHHLHRLHHQDRGGRLAGIIERSLGAGADFQLLESRSSLLSLAAAEGIRVPSSAVLTSEADLDRWEHPLPWVIKRSMSWGGEGVRVVRSRKEAASAFRALTRQAGIAPGLKRLVVNRDGFPLATSIVEPASEIIVQRFMDGQPANLAMVCRRGAMLAHLSVRALATEGSTGASTVVEVIDNADMTAAAERLARRLRLSGFHGLDFILDSSGAAWLIELNPRATQICHLSAGGNLSLAEILLTAGEGEAVPQAAIAAVGDEFAFFPQAWRSDPEHPLLHSVCHDVPWEEPELVVELSEPPYPNRGLLARAWQRYLSPRDRQYGWAPRRPVALQTLNEGPEPVGPERPQPSTGQLL
jgi:predicted ATP-grasp superfamily ATP-dependent carboligase